MVLTDVIQGENVPFADAASARLKQVFEKMAHVDIHQAEWALTCIAERCKDDTGVEAQCKARCRSLYDVLHPVLNSISQDAAARVTRERNFDFRDLR